jgi:multiple sugar transport system substrate-binding protein
MMSILCELSRSNVERRGKGKDLGEDLGSAQGLTRKDFLKVGGSVLASAYVLGMAGCGGGPQSQGGKVTLRYANWVASEAATRETITKAIEAFEKQNPNVKVQSVAIPFDQMRQQLVTMAAGGNPPDVMQLSGPWSQELGAQGALVDLRELATKSYLNDNYEGALKAGEYQGKLYAAPLSLTPHAFWYNRDLMEQAGLDPEQPPKTMSELNEQMAELKAKLPQGTYPIGLDTTKIDYALVQFWPWFYAFDARPLYGGEVNFDTPQVGNALQWLRDTVDKGYTPVGQQIKEERELMAKDKIVFKLDGPYLVGILRSLNTNLEGDAFYDKFAVTTVPVGANGKSETLADIHQIGISPQVEDQGAAWKFAKFLAGSKESIDQYQIPYGVIPPLKSDEKSDKFDDPVSQVYINEVFETMNGGPYGPKYGQAQQYIIEALQKAALENDPIEQILKETEQNLQGVYS